MPKRKYNYKVYSVVKNTNSFIRSKCSPNPTESLSVFGIIGKCLGFVINKIIAFPIHCLAFFITGLFYDKNKEKPYKGSFIYTIVTICLMFMIAGGIKLLVNFFA